MSAMARSGLCAPTVRIWLLLVLYISADTLIGSACERNESADPLIVTYNESADTSHRVAQQQARGSIQEPLTGSTFHLPARLPAHLSVCAPLSVCSTQAYLGIVTPRYNYTLIQSPLNTVSSNCRAGLHLTRMLRHSPARPKR
jgi:hypothetical protein